MIINHNMKAMNTHRMMTINASTMGKSTEKLSSGLRVNRAADDAAGLSISEKMRGQIRGLTQASRNAQDAISVVQTAEGALDEAHSILQRMRQLAVQSANDSNVQADRDAIQREVTQLTDELDRIAGTTEFNTQKLLDGSFQDRVFHVGANKDQNIQVSVKEMSAKGLGLRGGATGSESAELTSELTTKLGSLTTVQASIGAKAATLAAREGSLATIHGSIGKIKGSKAIKQATLASNKAGLEKAEDKIKEVNEKIEKLREKALTASPAQQATIAASIATLQGSVTALTTDSVVVLKGSIAQRFKELAALDGRIAAQEEEGANIGKNISERKEYLSKLNAKAKGLSKQIEDLREQLGMGATAGNGIKVSSQVAANAAIKTINAALTKVSTQRSELGAIQNRLEHTIKNLDNAAENTQAAESRIRDVDMALEMSEFTKKNILTQASQAMLAQANQLPQQVLQLLR